MIQCPSKPRRGRRRDQCPPRPEYAKGIKGWFFKSFQKAGGAVPSANRIMLLCDADGDGIAETRSVHGLEKEEDAQLAKTERDDAQAWFATVCEPSESEPEPVSVEEPPKTPGKRSPYVAD